jgi:predicted rRNA methylase YqxC with S4 and FtsJ domains
MDLAYLAIARAIEQLDRVHLRDDAELIALVKPMFELACATAPTDHESLALAIELAAAGLERHGWRVVSSLASPHPGARGAREGFVYARRAPP